MSGIAKAFIEHLEERRLLSGSTWSTDLDFRYGGAAAGALGIATDPGGAVYAAGDGYTASGFHALVMKKPYGGQWATTPVCDYQLAAGQNSLFRGIGADAAGNLYAVGNANDSDGISTWIVCKSADGGGSWTVVDRYRWVSARNSFALRVATDAQGAVYVVGYGTNVVQTKQGTTTIEHWLVRKSSDGGATWSVADDFAPTNGSRAQGITVSGSSIYVVGYSGTTWITRRSTDGGATWATIDQLPSQYDAFARGVAADDQGNVYVVGDMEEGSKMSCTDHWLVRKLAAGSTTWKTVDDWQLSANVGWTYGSLAEDVVTGPNGEVDVVGSGWANTSAYSEHYLTRISADGGATWQTTDDLPNSGNYTSRGHAITRDRDGNVLTAGQLAEPDGSHLAVRTNAPPPPAAFSLALISGTSAASADDSTPGLAVQLLG